MMKRFSLSAACAAAVAFGAFGATCTYTEGEWDTAPSGESDDIVIVSGNLTWGAALPHKVASWTQGSDYTGTVTFQTTYEELPAGVKNVTAFPLFEVTGNVTLNGGTWTHTAQPGYDRVASRVYRLAVKCGGDFTLGAGATVSAYDKGYSSAFNNSNDCGGAHGGYSSNRSSAPYGNLFAPEDPGEGSKYGGTYRGGGVIRLDIAGKFAHRGLVQANTSGNTSYCSGAGGSVYITAGSIEGSGLIQADAHQGGGRARGAGGRVAVILTGDDADFSRYDILNLASCTNAYRDATSGGCGTIYAEKKSDGARRGWLILKGNGKEPTGDDRFLAHPFTGTVPEIHPSRLTITNATRLVVYPGYTMDLTDTTLDIASDCGIVLRGGTLKCADSKTLTIASALRVSAASTIDADKCDFTNATVTVNTPLSFTGDVKAMSNVTFKTSGAANVPVNVMELDIAGDFDLTAFAKIDVSAQGYGATYYPDGKNTSAACGGTHGGSGNFGSATGESFLKPYGSIIDPMSWGSGSFQAVGYCQPGGGLAVLKVGGELTLNGSVAADSLAYVSPQRYAAAGGAVNVTAGTISGAGPISARPRANGGAGGGRVAIKLTEPNADFSDYTGTVSLGGGGGAGSRAGAGTLFLKTGDQSMSEGTLIIDNGVGTTASSPTLLGGADMEGTEFGSIVVTNAAKLKIAAGSTITVRGDLVNAGTTVSEAGSTVVLAGSGVTTISGNWNFANLSCATPGKVIRVTPGSTITVAENVVFAGESGANVRIECTEAEGEWNLAASAASISMGDVAIGGCQSDKAIIVNNGEDLGHNSANVEVKNVVAGDIVWTGSVGSGWGEPGNWDLARTPIKGDHVFVAPSANIPVLASDLEIATLTVLDGGRLDLADKALTVAGDLVVAGEMVTAAAQTITVGGNLEVGAGFAAGFSTVKISGATACRLTSDNATFYVLEIQAPSVEASGSIKAHTFAVGNGSAAREIVFATGAKLTANDLVVSGDKATPNVTLRPKVSGETWILSASRSTVSGAVVSGSDASAGVAVVPEKGTCTDGGGNANWLFNDTRIRWNGSVSAAFDVAENWDGGVVPGEEDAVVIEGVTAVSVSSEMSVGALTLGLGATLTVRAPLTVNGALTLEPNGTLIGDEPITVTGNLTVLDGATIKHTQNGSAETYKLRLTVQGSGFIGENGFIDLTGLGYNARKGPTTPDSHTQQGGSHGGRSGGNYQAYGSIVNPTTIGAGPGSNWGGHGGGAAILVFGGELTVDGGIVADGSKEDRCTGAGGSINLTAGSLVGSGVIHACGGHAPTSAPGGGGRIRVKLTGANAKVDDFKGDIGAYGGLCGLYVASSAGTVYYETASDQPGRGIVEIVNATNAESSNSYRTDFPATLDNNPKETRLVRVKVAQRGCLYLTADAKIASLEVDGTTNGRVLLNGHVLRINQPKPKNWTMPSYIDPGKDANGNPGRIEWGVGLAIVIR